MTTQGAMTNPMMPHTTATAATPTHSFQFGRLAMALLRLAVSLAATRMGMRAPTTAHTIRTKRLADMLFLRLPRDHSGDSPHRAQPDGMHVATGGRVRRRSETSQMSQTRRISAGIKGTAMRWRVPAIKCAPPQIPPSLSPASFAQACSGTHPGTHVNNRRYKCSYVPPAHAGVATAAYALDQQRPER